MKGRGRITLPVNEVGAAEQGVGVLDDFTMEASFGDYGRNANPSILATAGAASFSFEFATPDEARKLGEKLFELARKAEDKSGQRGPEYRAKIARDEFMTDFRTLVDRFEKATGPGEMPDLAKLLAKQ